MEFESLAELISFIWETGVATLRRERLEGWCGAISGGGAQASWATIQAAWANELTQREPPVPSVEAHTDRLFAWAPDNESVSFVWMDVDASQPDKGDWTSVKSLADGLKTLLKARRRR